MRNVFKILFAVIAVVVVLFAGAAVALVAFFDPNDYKSTLTGQVQEITGRELAIEGDLELSLFPWLGVKTGAMTLGNPAGFDAAPFAHIEAAEARAKLVPLFRGKLEMDTVVLKGLDLNLVRLRNGKDNWSGLAGEKAAPAEGAAETGTGDALAALAIGGVDIDNAAITWDDRLSGERIELRKLNLKTGELQLGAPMAFSMSSQVSRKSDGMNGSIEASSTLRMNPFEGSYAAKGLNLAVNLKGKNFPGGQLDAALRADVAADLIRQTLSLDNLEASALSLQANGKLHATSIRKDPTYKGELGLKQFNPRTLMALLGNKIDLADPKALGSAQFDLGFDGSTNRINFSKLTGKLDDTNINGKLAVNDIGNMAISFDLALDQVDLDRYRGSAAGGQPATTPQAATPAAAAVASAEVLPVELLRGLNVNGKAAIDRLRVAQIDITNISMTANAKNGDIHLYPVRANVSDGSYDGNIRINVKGAQPVISVNERLTNVETGPLVHTFSGYDALSGKGNITAVLTTSGNTDSALRRNLNGTLNFNIGNGLIKGINIDHQLRTAYAVIKTRPLPSDKGVKDTVFSSFKANATVTNGVLDNRDLQVYTDNLRIDGDGTVNLVNETINYRLGANVIKSYEGPDSEEFNELKRLTVPIIIKGALNNPSINVDLERLLTEKAKQKLEKKLIESILGEPKKAEPAPQDGQPAPAPAEKKKPEDEVKDLLKGLFK